MSDEQATEEPEKKKGKGMLIVGVVMLAAAGAGGFCLPLVAPQLFSAEEEEKPAEPKPVSLKPSEVGFLDIGEVVVNLNLDRFNRYLKLKLTVEVAKDELATMEKLLEDRKAVLRGWLLSHLADKTMDEIRGAAGQNQLRREIHDQFNALLSEDGYDVINDVYFEEFNVQ